MTDVIAVERLTKSYGRARGVVDLTFTVSPGEVFGYLGPNGAGKTTTIRTLLDFIRPTSGRASVFGLDARRDGIEIHRRTGYLAGEMALYERLTGAEYLRHLGLLRGGVDPGSVGALADRLD
jgi:ABC-2 type transport system ATP-binding protein